MVVKQTTAFSLRRSTFVLCLLVSFLSQSVVYGDVITNLSITLRGPGGAPYLITDNGANGRDTNPAANVIQFKDPGEHFNFQQGFFGIDGGSPTLTAVGTPVSLEVILTDLRWNNFSSPDNLSSIAFSLIWNNKGGPGTFAEIAAGTWSLPGLVAGAPKPLPEPSPVRGTIHQAGEGGGITLLDQQTDVNNTIEPKVVPLALNDGPKEAEWAAMAAVFGILQFDVTNDAAFTVGTHVVQVPGSAHWRATVVPEPSSWLMLGAGLGGFLCHSWIVAYLRRASVK